MHAQYAYITDADKRLVGVLRLRDLLLLERHESIRQAMTSAPQRLPSNASLDELSRFFDRHSFFAVPVVNAEDRILGVVLRVDVEEAVSERADHRMLLMSGILVGEESRSMRWTDRLVRRGPWLAVSLLLSLTAASIIGWYEDTLAEVIALAMFLPVISGLGGNSGNQALSISIRELSRGLVKPEEFAWVAGKEAALGLVNGVLIGSALGLISFVWQRDIKLSVVVSLAIGANTVAAACLGGILPLALKRLGWDPAVAAGPILFTVVDLFGFLMALTLADHYL
jgi:magnesium transporter